MIIIIRTKEDAEAIMDLAKNYRLGGSLTLVNMTELTFPLISRGHKVRVVQPNTNQVIY